MSPVRLGASLVAALLAVGAAVRVIPLAARSGAYIWKNVQIVGGGFVPGIVFSDAEAGLVYARTDIGGAYRMDSTTGGRWVPLLDWVDWDTWGHTGVVSLAADPVNASTVYCAVGTYTNGWDPTNGAILKSTDRGATWSVSPLPFKVGGNMPGRGAGERLAIDPNNPNILYFGAGGNATTTFGLWKSTNAGGSWSQVSFPGVGDWRDDPADPNDYLSHRQGIWWVVFDKDTGSSGSATQHVYVGVATKSGPTIYRSTNAGTTWSAVVGQPGVGTLMPRKAKLDAVNDVLYVAYGSKAGPYDDPMGDVYKLHTGTGVWTRISPMPSDDSNGDNYFGYNGLSIDRQNPGTVMVTAYSSWWPDTIVWRSTDGGATWSQIWEWTRYPSRSFKYVQDITAAPWLFWGGAPTGGGRPGAEVFPKLGWMTESLEIDPFNSNRMMYGTGATIYGSDDLTKWDIGQQITIKVMAAGLEETAIQEIVSPPAGPPLLSGMYDIYGFTHQNLDVVPTSFFENPRIATLSIDYAESNPSYIFRVGAGNATEGVKAAGFSTNGGSTWTVVRRQPSGVSTGGGTVAVNAAGTRVVWGPTDGPVSYSTDNGGRWTSSSGIPQGALVESDRVNSNKFYGFLNGTFYMSINGGASFAAAATGLPATAQFRAVAGREGHIWLAGYATGLWRSIDSGASFTNVGAVEQADTIGFGKAAPEQSYPAIYTSAKIGGVRGIYRSDNEGSVWVRINDDQHQWGWTGKTITGDPRVYGRVYIATNGRGIIYGDLVP